MNALLAFPVALPLAGAGFIALTDDSTPEELKDIPAMLIAAATTTISTIIRSVQAWQRWPGCS